MIRAKAVLCLSTLLLLAGCDLLNSGGGTEGEGLSGQLVNSQGQPASGALVRAFSADSGSGSLDSLGRVDSVRADTGGRFRFSHLPAGRYNLEGSLPQNGGKLASLVSGIVFKGKLDIGTDTLRASGSILIHAESDGTPVEGTTCYIPGSSFIVISDDSGACKITGVPPGVFQVRLRHEGLLARSSGYLQVRSGQTTDLGVLILVADPAQPPPEPKGVIAQYDITTRVVTVRWRKVQVPDLAGYVVYKREDFFSTPERLTVKLIQDTVYRDTLREPPPLPPAFLYQVKSQDWNGNLSLQYSDPAEVKTR